MHINNRGSEFIFCIHFKESFVNIFSILLYGYIFKSNFAKLNTHICSNIHIYIKFPIYVSNLPCPLSSLYAIDISKISSSCYMEMSFFLTSSLNLRSSSVVHPMLFSVFFVEEHFCFFFICVLHSIICKSSGYFVTVFIWF